MFESNVPLRFIAHTNVAYNASAGTTGALNGNTRAVRIMCTSAAYVTMGAAPTATANDIYLPANTELMLAIPPGTWKISAIQVSAGGTLHVTELM